MSISQRYKCCKSYSKPVRHFIIEVLEIPWHTRSSAQVHFLMHPSPTSPSRRAHLLHSCDPGPPPPPPTAPHLTPPQLYLGPPPPPLPSIVTLIKSGKLLGGRGVTDPHSLHSYMPRGGGACPEYTLLRQNDLCYLPTYIQPTPNQHTHSQRPRPVRTQLEY